MSTSFLHAASAKMIAERLRSAGIRRAASSADDIGPRDYRDRALRLAETRRLLLVEEDEGFVGVGGGLLARSLAVDAALSLASSETDPCRGCRSTSVPATTATATTAAACRCCRVALLVAGRRPRKTNEKKKRRRRRRANEYGSVVLPSPGDDARRIEFPMSCVERRDGIDDDDDDDDGKWDPAALDRIRIKYVSSLSDVVRYLAYVTSLPDHSRPSRGLFLLGANDCLSSRQNVGMELVHLVSMLSDTASALEDMGRERTKSTNTFVSEDHRRADDYDGLGGNIAVVATIDKVAYSSVPPKVVGYFHHWMDTIATIGPARSEGFLAINARTHSEWELTFKNTDVSTSSPKLASINTTDRGSSFAFRVNERGNESNECDREPSHQISWSL